MNVLAHVFVSTTAFRHAAEVPLAVGSILPDVCSVAKVRVNQDMITPEVQFGIETHHAADSVFHAHPLFIQAIKEIRYNLEQSGIPRGPATACAHVGFELLMDGCLQDAGDLPADLIEETFSALYAVTVGGSDDRVRFLSAADGIASRVADGTYRCPDQVAARLSDLLQNRPRLALTINEVPALRDCLAEAQPSIARATSELLSHISNEISLAVADG